MLVVAGAGVAPDAALIQRMALADHNKASRLTKEQLEYLMAWRSEALELMPYFARILFSFRPLNASGLGTFACDRHYRLYIDFEAVVPKGLRWCAEALLHECGHMYNDHSGRASEHDVQADEKFLWNVAGDCEINDDLVAAGCQSIADNGVLPMTIEMENNLLAETYMDSLRQQSPCSGNGSGSGSQGFDGCGSGAGGIAAPCELRDDDDCGGAAPAASEIEKKAIAAGTAAAIREQAAKSIGSVPAGLVTRAEAILAPSKIPWRQVLSSSIRRATAMRAGVHDTTYLRPNRRRAHVDVAPGRRGIYPGSYSPDPLIAVVRDTSGSMSQQELSMVTVEVEGIAKQLGVRDKSLQVIDVDTDINAVRGYHGVSSLSEVTGRGGTDMGAGIAYAVAMRPRPTVVVVITDGYTPWPDVKPRVPVVICVVGRGDLSNSVGSAPKWATVVAVDTTADIDGSAD